METLTIGITAFFIIFISQILFIIKKENKDINENLKMDKKQYDNNSKLLLKIFLSFIISIVLSTVVFIVSIVIFLGNNLSI